MGRRIERVIRANGRFIEWWVAGMDEWSKSRQKGFLGWVFHEISWFILLPISLLLYAYLAFSFVTAWGLRLWYVAAPILIAGYHLFGPGLPV